MAVRSAVPPLWCPFSTRFLCRIQQILPPPPPPPHRFFNGASAVRRIRRVVLSPQFFGLHLHVGIGVPSLASFFFPGRNRSVPQLSSTPFPLSNALAVLSPIASFPPQSGLVLIPLCRLFFSCLSQPGVVTLASDPPLPKPPSVAEQCLLRVSIQLPFHEDKPFPRSFSPMCTREIRPPPLSPPARFPQEVVLPLFPRGRLFARVSPAPRHFCPQSFQLFFFPAVPGLRDLPFRDFPARIPSFPPLLMQFLFSFPLPPWSPLSFSGLSTSRFCLAHPRPFSPPVFTFRAV